MKAMSASRAARVCMRPGPDAGLSKMVQVGTWFETDMVEAMVSHLSGIVTAGIACGESPIRAIINKVMATLVLPASPPPPCSLPIVCSLPLSLFSLNTQPIQPIHSPTLSSPSTQQHSAL